MAWVEMAVQAWYNQAMVLVEEAEEQGPLCLCPCRRLVPCPVPCAALSVSSHCWSVAWNSEFGNGRAVAPCSTVANCPNWIDRGSSWVWAVAVGLDCGRRSGPSLAAREVGKQCKKQHCAFSADCSGHTSKVCSPPSQQQ